MSDELEDQTDEELVQSLSYRTGYSPPGLVQLVGLRELGEIMRRLKVTMEKSERVAWVLVALTAALLALSIALLIVNHHP